jgi:beta-barrel assembly-enhancing protease
VTKSVAGQEPEPISAGLEKRFASLQSIIAAPTFKALPGDTQYRDLLTAGRLAISLKQQRRGYDLIVRAVAMPQADFYDRVLQVQVALTLRLTLEAVSGMEVAIRRWPDQLGDLPTGLLDQLLRESSSLPHRVRLQLLRSLYAAHWKRKWDIEPSGAWSDLALLLLERGLLPEAVEVSSRVNDVYVLIGMKADRRFDALVAARPEQFDIDAAAARQLHELGSASDQSPGSLELKLDVMLALLHQQHYAAMLAESDSVLLGMRSTNFPAKLYEDYYTQYARFLNLRSIALQRAGRWDEAVAELRIPSVAIPSPLINLAVLYCELERPKDAAETIGRVKENTSPYGAMRVQWVRLEAAVQLGDKQQVATSLQYLRGHAADAPAVYLDALLSVNEQDQAADVLMRRLKDFDQRQEALLLVQDYVHPPETARDIEFTARWRSVVASKEVQAAIVRVGRVESYRLEAP